jgi:phenylpyruvate tautomerase PptA (4-oxalocrotonate tautomerase family)
MPFIHLIARPGRDDETKSLALDALVAAASKAWGAPPEAFTVVFDECPAEEWDEKVTAKYVTPNRSKLVYEKGNKLI